MLVPSRYNFCVPLENSCLLFNASSGSLIHLEGLDAIELGKVLMHPVSYSDSLSLSLDEKMIFSLHSHGFLVEKNFDEVDVIHERYQKARGRTPMVLTITTTMDCNLGCYYCYESRSKHKLQEKDIDKIVSLAKKRLQEENKNSLHVDWYGGEPLMNLEFLENASYALQKMCEDEGIKYVASIISNGTCWPPQREEFILRHKIKQVQISFDGLQENHDKRRHYRKGYAPAENVSSFDLAVALVDNLVNSVRVDVRFNIDRNNVEDLLPFIDFIRNRGWFRGKYPVVFQPARLASYSEKSLFMREWELSLEEFDRCRALVREAINGETLIEESEAPDGFPYPKTTVCAALAKSSFVVGADGAEYRCGLQVGEKNRHVGTLHSSPLVTSSSGDKEWWEKYDPTTNPNCKKCSFLPICWGGCPKKHLEGDVHAIKEQGFYWRTNLPRLLAKGAKVNLTGDFTFTEQDQFRDLRNSIVG